MRIFDNPNHPQYGPVRRMWVIFAQLDLLAEADRRVRGWDERLAVWVQNGMGEAPSQRAMLRHILEEM